MANNFKLQQRKSSMTPVQLQAYEEEGKAILRSLAEQMDKKVQPSNESNLGIIESHYQWAKKLIAPNKGEYIIYLRTLSSSQGNIVALNSIKPGLPAYVRETGMAFLNKLN